MKKIAHGQDAGFQQEVVPASLGGGDKEDAERRGFGLLDRQAVAAGDGRGDVFAETVLLVVGVVGKKLVRQLLGGFGAHVHFEKEKANPFPSAWVMWKPSGLSGKRPCVFFPVFLSVFVKTTSREMSGCSGWCATTAQARRRPGPNPTRCKNR